MTEATPELTRAERATKRAKSTWWQRRVRPPRRLRITREGWVFILVTVGVGAAAVNTGNNLLFLVLGLQLSLIVISGVMSESTLRRIKVERHLPPRIHARLPSLIEVTLHTRKQRLPSYSIELEDLLDGWSTDKRCYFLKVAPQGKQTAAYRTVIPRRGMLTFTGYRVATRFPFALFEKWREIDLVGDVIVYPEIVDVPQAKGAGHRPVGEHSRRRQGQGDELYGLRELRPGDDYRAIHWRTSARRGRLMAREYEAEESRKLCIYLDHRRRQDATEGSPDPTVERAIAVTASLALERAAAGQSIHLAVRGAVAPQIHPGSSPDRLLRYLALLEEADANNAEPFGQLPIGEAILVAETSRATGFDGAVIAIETPSAEEKAS